MSINLRLDDKLYDTFDIAMTAYNHHRLSNSLLNDLWQERDKREQKAIYKRKYTRFNHHSGTMLELKVSDTTGDWLTTYGFIANESFGGLGLLAVTSHSLAVNQLCQVNMPGIGWIKGRIAWTKPLDDDIQEIGIKYAHY